MAFQPRQPRKENHWRHQDAPRARSNLRAFMYFVEPNQIDGDAFDELQDRSDGKNAPEIPLLQEWFENWVLSGRCTDTPPRRGDLIQVSWLQYRNDGLYIIDFEPRNGKLVVRDLFYDIDDYGSLPPNFTLLEFPPCYFDAITHNFYRWLPTDLIDSESTAYTFPRQLFVPDNISEVNQIERPVLRVEGPNGLYFWLLGITEMEASNEHEFKEKFMKAFVKALQKPTSFHGKEYLNVDCEDPLYGRESPLMDPMHTLFVYCDE